MEDESAETGGDDPFATVDGGSSENAGAFDSFSNQPVEVKEEEAAALKSDQHIQMERGDEGAERAAPHRWADVCPLFFLVCAACCCNFFFVPCFFCTVACHFL